MPSGVYTRKPIKSSQIEIICLNCGKTRLEYPSRIKKGLGKFCSKKCSAIFNIPRTKTRLHNKENYVKISKSLTGKKTNRIPIHAFKKGQIAWNKGVHKFNGGGHQKGNPTWNKGKTGIYSAEVLQQMGLAAKRRLSNPENHPMWKGGITPINAKIRHSFEYEEWRKEVFERDNYTCQHCGEVGGYLQADHIKEFAKYPELRLDINNGQALCKRCHYIKTWGKKPSIQLTNQK